MDMTRSPERILAMVVPFLDAKTETPSGGGLHP
jgi:hypothetical protein